MQGDSPVMPRLRFPEFSGQPLRQVRLRDVTAESLIRNSYEIPSMSVMGVSKVDGIVPMVERIIGSDIARYKVVRKDWFAYNPMRLNIGSIARWQGEAEVLVSPDYVVFRCLDDETGSGMSPDYLDHFRQSQAWGSFVKEGGDGGVRIRIYYKDLGSLRLTLPSREEQQKVADFLTSLDEVIAAEERRAVALKTHKRGLVQQLFPSEGETLPRLRFTEFGTAPEWRERLLGEEGEFLTSLSGKTAADFDTGDAHFIPYSNVFANTFVDTEALRHVDVNQEETQNAVRRGDVLFTVSSETQQDSGMSSVLLEDVENCYLNSFCTLFRFYDERKLDERFAGYLFRSEPVRSYLASKAQGAIRYNLSRGVFRGIKFVAPCVREQQLIAGLLFTLDSAIAALSKKIDVLKANKKGLMQQLFLGPEEA